MPPTASTKMRLHREARLFLAEPRERSSKDGTTYGSLIVFESQKIKKIVLSTTAAELYFSEMFWFLPGAPWTMDGYFW